MKVLSLILLTMFVSCIKSEDTEVEDGSITGTSRKEYYSCNNSGSTSNSSHLTFYSTGSYKHLITYYSATHCANDKKTEMNLFTGTYSFNETTMKMTEKAMKLQIAFASASEVATQNGLNNCGFSDWAVNVYKDATDNDDCNGGTVYSNSAPYVYDAVLNDSVFDDGATLYYRINP